MLVEFKVKNVLSFKDETILSMVATSISENPQNVLSPKYRDKLLKSAVIYGANSSGKSNLFKALRFMRWFILNSSKESQSGEAILVNPFKLSASQNKLRDTLRPEPSSYEITLIHDDIPYRYGFSATSSEIVEEWLYYRPKTKEITLFNRNHNTIDIHPKWFKEGKGLDNKDQERTRKNALFLSVAAQWNGGISTKIIEWFRQLLFISAVGEEGYKEYMEPSLSMLLEASHNHKTLSLLQSVGINIEALIPKSKTYADETEWITLEVSKKTFDETGKEAGHIVWPFSYESEGTKKLIALSGPIFDALDQNRVLVIDEFDTQLHPLMSQALISLFHSTDASNEGAQLIFATHDTNLLSNELFRRDQIWFTEKDQFDASHLYSLVEYKQSGKSIRKDSGYEKNYIAGKYGAIPYINIEKLKALLTRSLPA